MNFAACRKLHRFPLAGTWYRALELQFLPSPLSSGHTKRYSGRFSPGPRMPQPFAILYLCEHPVLTLQEVEAIYGTLAPGHVFPDPRRAWSIINIDVQLQAVVNLTEPSQLQLLGTSVQELTGDWRSYNAQNVLAPTQRLGMALCAPADLEGFIVPSAKSANERNLNVFPGNLKRGSWIRFRNPLTGKTHAINGKK